MKCSITEIVLLLTGGMILGVCLMSGFLALDLADNRAYYVHEECKHEQGPFEYGHTH